MAKAPRPRPTPPAGPEALTERVRGLSPHAREALGYVNAGGRRGLPSFTPQAVLDELEAAGLVDARGGTVRPTMPAARLRAYARREG